VVTALLALFGALVGGAVMLVVRGVGSRAERTSAADPRRRRVAGAERWNNKLSLVALVAGLAALLVTRWPVGGALAFAAVLSSRGLTGSAPKVKIAHLEAIATWTEMLRDTLAAAAGISQALAATAKVAPPSIRAEVQTLAARISTGVPPGDALVLFSDEMSDQSADLVVAALMMATEHHAQRIGDLLGPWPRRSASR
jgi:tight adherence protein B